MNDLTTDLRIQEITATPTDRIASEHIQELQSDAADLRKDLKDFADGKIDADVIKVKLAIHAELSKKSTLQIGAEKQSNVRVRNGISISAMEEKRQLARLAFSRKQVSAVQATTAPAPATEQSAGATVAPAEESSTTQSA